MINIICLEWLIGCLFVELANFLSFVYINNKQIFFLVNKLCIIIDCGRVGSLKITPTRIRIKMSLIFSNHGVGSSWVNYLGKQGFNS